MEANRESLIDGSWYEKQYATKGSDYHKMYVEGNMNPYIGATQEFFADYALSIIKPEKGSRTLEIGCGTGFYTKHFDGLGYDSHGIEVSQSAVNASNYDKIKQGNAISLPEYDENEFSVAYSVDVIEHIDESYIDKVFQDIMRISKVSFHYIASEKGVDPGHITIKTPEEWINYFRTQHKENFSFIFPNPIMPKYPLYIMCRDKESIPYTIINGIMNRWIL